MVAMTSSHNPVLSNQPDPNSIITEIMDLLSKASEKLEPENRETKQWMVQNARNPKVAEILLDSSWMTLRVVDAIGKLEPVNGITISKQYKIPKGSVSKTTRRLIAQKLITKETLPNNKKEVLFRLTPLGRDLFEVHRAFDQQMERGFVRFLQKYDSDQLHFLALLLQDVIETSFLELGSQV
jgi:DNA-binding MarR family transcriptional regulator